MLMETKEYVVAAAALRLHQAPPDSLQRRKCKQFAANRAGGLAVRGHFALLAWIPNHIGLKVVPISTSTSLTYLKVKYL